MKVSSFICRKGTPWQFQLLGVVLLTAFAGVARAEYYAGLPADTPAIYRSECGSCHVAFPPGLLSSSWGFLSGDGWRQVMNNLPKHFGDKVELDEPTRRKISDFLLRYAADSRRFDARGDSPRLTSTTWFVRMHGSVRPFAHDSRIGSLANCTACHPLAEVGHYEQLAPLARQIMKKG
ncbi:MAG TPA: hypothetical protein VFK88_08500 [Gallionella sp.]|nr:hypothetical protein [Gallionella sp.]